MNLYYLKNLNKSIKKYKEKENQSYHFRLLLLCSMNGVEDGTNMEDHKQGSFCVDARAPRAPAPAVGTHSGVDLTAVHVDSRPGLCGGWSLR